MSKLRVAIVTDSNSGITQKEAKELGVFVLPMPFIAGGETFLDEIDLSQEQFYEMLEQGKDISTSQPSPEAVMSLWEKLLIDYDEIVHIPMSSGLSGSCQSATLFAEDYEGIYVVNNQRISVTQRRSVLDAKELADLGLSGANIKKILEEDKMNSSIYIMLDTLYYLKKGGRITPAAAALGTILKIKPVLQIQGEKLDAFAKVRTVSQGKNTMIHQIKKDMETRFGGATPDECYLQIAYTKNVDAALAFREEVLQELPGFDIVVMPLSLSVGCHIGPGALAIACCKKLKY